MVFLANSRRWSYLFPNPGLPNFYSHLPLPPLSLRSLELAQVGLTGVFSGRAEEFKVFNWKSGGTITALKPSSFSLSSQNSSKSQWWSIVEKTGQKIEKERSWSIGWCPIKLRLITSLGRDFSYLTPSILLRGIYWNGNQWESKFIEFSMNNSLPFEVSRGLLALIALKWSNSSKISLRFRKGKASFISQRYRILLMKSLPLIGTRISKAPIQQLLGRAALPSMVFIRLWAGGVIFDWFSFETHPGFKRRKTSHAHRLLIVRPWHLQLRAGHQPLHGYQRAAGGSNTPQTSTASSGDGTCPHCFSILVIFSEGPFSISKGILYT